MAVIEACYDIYNVVSLVFYLWFLTANQ